MMANGSNPFAPPAPVEPAAGVKNAPQGLMQMPVASPFMMMPPLPFLMQQMQ